MGSSMVTAAPAPTVLRLSLSMLSASKRSLSWKMELCDKPGTRAEALELKTISKKFKNFTNLAKKYKTFMLRI
jgi:hypothetical protein